MLQILFALLVLLEIASISLVFEAKNVLHSVIMLSISFIISSLIFAFIGQPLIALLQIFIMVGGVMTYMFIGMASAGISRFKHVSYISLALYSIIILAVLSYSVMNASYTEGANNLSRSSIALQLTSGLGIIAVAVIALFGVGIGSIVLLKALVVGNA
jgi:NADH-quinone oxidoreductase subunit J